MDVYFISKALGVGVLGAEPRRHFLALFAVGAQVSRGLAK